MARASPAALPTSRVTTPKLMKNRPAMARNRLVPLRSTAAIRSAAMGLMRAARNAGMNAYTRVTTVPTAITWITAPGRLAVTISGLTPGSAFTWIES